MTIDYQHILDTASDLVQGHGDRPFVHQRAKDLRALLDAVIADTRPGIGEFKWTAKARKALTITANTRKGNPALCTSTLDGEPWHGDGCYMVKGAPSKRFEPFDVREINEGALRSVIPDWTTLPCVTVGEPIDADKIELSNGTHVNRTYLDYVTSLAGDNVTYYNDGPIFPIVVVAFTQTTGYRVAGLIMPVRK